MYIGVISLQLSGNKDILNKNSSCDNRQSQVPNEINVLKFTLVCVCSEEIFNIDQFQVNCLFLVCGKVLLSKQNLAADTELVSNKLKYS